MSKDKALAAKAVADRIEQAVGEAESRTSAEIAVVIGRQSGSYADVDLRWGIVVAAAVMLAIVFLPLDFPDWSLALALPAFFAVAWAASRHLPWLRHWLTRANRRVAQVREGAELAFVRQGVSHTVHRTGILIYASWLERRAEVIADVGVLRHVPRHEWNLAEATLRGAAIGAKFPDELLAALHEMSLMLAKYLPPVEGVADEIPKRPVFL
jgi:putative membrane protein